MKRLVFLALFVTACQSPPPPPTAADIAAIPADAPDIFVRGDRVGFVGIEDLYLGQSEADALEAMGKMCKRLVDLKGGWQRANTTFKGCHLTDHALLYTFRVGFNPKIGNRVFTLEVKRRQLDENLVRLRFWERFDGVTKELARRGLLQAETPKYNFFADWEDGMDGPAHLLVGLSDAEVDRLAHP